MKTIKNLTADQIRKSILQLAIQGKLVKQDPNDEPASELVKRIYEEKHKLIKEGKIKKDKNESYIYKGDDNCYYEKVGSLDVKLLENIPFELPNGWTWIRQSNLCWLDNGNKTQSGELPYLEAKVIRQNKPDKYQTSGVVVDSNFKLILVDGENSGEIFTPPFKGYMGSTFKILDVTPEIDFEYLLLVFEFNLDLYRNSKTGAAIPHLNKKLFKESLIALPPLHEQQRIVSKVLEFEPLLERYRTIENELTKYEISFEERLKASILQYAIEGKLVKQDPNDEPASKLLERIREEKEKLIKEGKIKREKADSIISVGDDKNYYENLPKGWVNSKLSFVINLVSGVDLSQSEYSSDNIGIPYITGASNFHNGKIIFNRYTKVKYVNSQKGDILITCKGTIGELAFNDIGDCHIARQIMAIKSFLNSEFLTYWLLSKRKQFISNGKSIIPGIDRKTILNAVIYIPPLLEEERIVFKLNLIFNKL